MSILLHITGLWLLDLLKISNFSSDKIINILFNPAAIPDDSNSKLTSIYFTSYIFAISFIGFVTGYACQWIVLKQNLDMRYSILKMSSEWWYLFEGRSRKQLDLIILDVYMKGEENYVYSGILEEYFFINNRLEKTYLSDIQRRDLTQTTTEEEHIKSFDIEGNSLNEKQQTYIEHRAQVDNQLKPQNENHINFNETCEVIMYDEVKHMTVRHVMYLDYLTIETHIEKNEMQEAIDELSIWITEVNDQKKLEGVKKKWKHIKKDLKYVRKSKKVEDKHFIDLKYELKELLARLFGEYETIELWIIGDKINEFLRAADVMQILIASEDTKAVIKDIVKEYQEFSDNTSRTKQQPHKEDLNKIKKRLLKILDELYPNESGEAFSFKPKQPVEN